VREKDNELVSGLRAIKFEKGEEHQDFVVDCMLGLGGESEATPIELHQLNFKNSDYLLVFYYFREFQVELSA
jgi:NAD(P)H-hydrate repair Nnr-like enzyme with NAD(P)H-hydrate epimerase domain